MNNLDPEKLKIPAYLRKKGITTRAKQKLILTALDRKNAGLSHKSTRALAPMKKPRKQKETVTQNARTSQFVAPTLDHDAKLFRFLGASRETLQDQVKVKMARQNTFEETENSGRILESPEVFTTFQSPTFNKPENAPREQRSEISKLISIGKVIGYYSKIQVAIIHLDVPLRVGEVIQLTSQKFLFQQPVKSMQIDRQDVTIAKKGADIGLKVAFPVENQSTVYKIIQQ